MSLDSERSNCSCAAESSRFIVFSDRMMRTISCSSVGTVCFMFRFSDGRGGFNRRGRLGMNTVSENMKASLDDYAVAPAKEGALNTGVRVGDQQRDLVGLREDRAMDVTIIGA